MVPAVTALACPWADLEPAPAGRRAARRQRFGHFRHGLAQMLLLRRVNQPAPQAAKAQPGSRIWSQ